MKQANKPQQPENPNKWQQQKGQPQQKPQVPGQQQPERKQRQG